MKFKVLNEKINFIPIFPGQDGKYTDQHGVQILPGAFATEQSAIRAELQPEYAKSGRINAKDVRSITSYIPSNNTDDEKSGQHKGSNSSSKGQNQSNNQNQQSNQNQSNSQNQQSNQNNQQSNNQNSQNSNQNQQSNNQNNQNNNQNQQSDQNQSSNQNNNQNNQNQQNKNLGGSDDGYLYIDDSTGEEFLMINGELVPLDEIYV